LSIPPTLALTQGDPAGVGPEILLKALQGADLALWRPLLVAERSALETLRPVLPDFPWERLRYLAGPEEDPAGEAGVIPVLDPVGGRRTVTPGTSGPADAAGAMAGPEVPGVTV